MMKKNELISIFAALFGLIMSLYEPSAGAIIMVLALIYSKDIAINILPAFKTGVLISILGFLYVAFAGLNVPASINNVLLSMIMVLCVYLAVLSLLDFNLNGDKKQ